MAIPIEQFKDMEITLKSKMTENLRKFSNQSLEKNSGDLSIIRQRLINSMTAVLDHYGFSSSRNDIEYYVDNIAISEMRKTHQSFVAENYQNFDKINEAMIRTITSKSQAEDKTTEEKNNMIEKGINKSDSKLQTLQELYANRIDLSAQFTDLFRSVITTNGVYSNSQAVEELKRIILVEKENAEQMLKSNVSTLINQNRNSTIMSAKSFYGTIIQLEKQSQEVIQNVVEQTRQKAEDDIIIEYVEVPQQPQLSPQTQELVNQAQTILSHQNSVDGQSWQNNNMNEEAARRAQLLQKMSLEELKQYEKTGAVPEHLLTQNIQVSEGRKIGSM